MYEILPNLFLSNYEDAQDESLLSTNGITKIVNLSCCDSLSKLPVLYLPIPDDEMQISLSV